MVRLRLTPRVTADLAAKAEILQALDQELSQTVYETRIVETYESLTCQSDRLQADKRQPTPRVAPVEDWED